MQAYNQRSTAPESRARREGRHVASIAISAGLGTMLKVDLIPLKRCAFTREEARRAQTRVLEAGRRPVRVASAEDAILTKLEWFEIGRRSSARPWNDILGIMRQRGAALDVPYLTQWASALGVRDLLEQVLVEAGLKQP